MRVLRLAGLVVVVCVAGNGWCQLPDELPNFPAPGPESAPAVQRLQSDPSVTHLVFMPTYEVMPAGTATYGVADLVVPKLTFCPTSFLQVGISASVLPTGLVTAGMKARLVRSSDGRSGVAAGIFHAGLDVFDDSWSSDNTQLTSLYVTAGAHSGPLEFHASVMRVRTRWNETTRFAPPEPFASTPGTTNEIRYTTIIGAGMKAPLSRAANAVLECWTWNDGDRVVLLALPALQMFGDGVSAEIGSLPIMVSDEIEFGFLPILIFTKSIN